MSVTRQPRRIFLLIALLTALSCAGPAQAASTPSTVKKPTVKAAAKKPAEGQAAKKAEAPKPAALSPFSLDGRVFKRSKGGDRLTDDDAARYARIFAFQDIGNFKKANEEIEDLRDHRLMGHVLYQRFTGKDYKAVYKELADWMKLYRDHPGAQKIYAMAQNRRPRGATLTEPRPSRGMTAYHDYDSGQLAQPYMADQKYSPRERDVMAEISRSLSENPTRALGRLEGAISVFSATKYDALRAQIAESYFYNGKTEQAHKLAAASSDRSGKDIPLAGWIAGLSAWKMGDYAAAATHFERAANSPRASAWMVSAGAHWAARSYLRGHQPQKVGKWLRRAAEYPRSFYGIISAKALGMEQSRFNWEMPELKNRLVGVLAEIPAGRRALALTDARRPMWAEQELRQINPGNDETLQEAMMALAHESGAPAFEMRLGSGLKDKRGDLYDAALYPDAPWQPEGGYHVDKALVHAFIRQESKFDAEASNKSSGATGVMQLMPSTAMSLARKYDIRADKDKLREPAVNIRLGQKYLADMLHEGRVRNNLFKLAVAYNAGPGKLSRWEKEVHYGNDPLLFIESIPVSETRIFVERVLTNYWIYRIKYGQDTGSLEKAAAGKWPLYAP